MAMWLRMLAAAVLLGAMPRMALAQSGDVPPPARYRLDANGVNLATGAFLLQKRLLSIGPDGPGGLAYDVQVNSSNKLISSWGLALYQSGTSWSASTGFTSRTFSQSGSTFTATDGSGASLAASGSNYVLTDADGTVIVYDYATHDASDGTLVRRATERHLSDRRQSDAEDRNGYNISKGIQCILASNNNHLSFCLSLYILL